VVSAFPKEEIFAVTILRYNAQDLGNFSARSDWCWVLLSVAVPQNEFPRNLESGWAVGKIIIVCSSSPR